MNLLKSGFTGLICIVLFVSLSFGQTTKKKKTTVKKTTTTTSQTVTDSEISGGLKEALSNGVRFAIDTLGKENGFLNDVRVKIPLPKNLQKIEKGLRVAGQGKVVDEFVASMNHAAEKAVPVAIDVFVDAIKQMSFDDARKILFSGESDAATQFFRRTSEENLRGKFRPIVEKFTAEAGVTNKYKTMIGKYGFAAKLLGNDATDLDGYVTQKALDGLFFMVAQEELKIRKDPIGRTTSLLKKVFGILK
jgi:Protein of unknown function (DUF4197)